MLRATGGGLGWRASTAVNVLRSKHRGRVQKVMKGGLDVVRRLEVKSVFLRILN